MPRWCRTAFSVVMAAVATLYFASPDASRFRFTLFGCTGAVAIVERVLVHRLRHVAPPGW